MVAIQSISARIGRTTGLGIAGNLLRHCPKWLLHGLVAALTFANVCNIGADLNLVALAIMATTAATLHVSNVKEIESAAQAAEALRPLAGPFAFSLFSLGIVGTGLLAVPVLAGSAAYALGEARRWPVGLSRQPKQAKAFYGTIAVATLIGAVANALKVSPIKALVWSAVLNAIAAAPIMVRLIQMATNPTAMGKFTISRRSRAVGWFATLVMGVASLGFIISSGFG